MESRSICPTTSNHLGGHACWFQVSTTAALASGLSTTHSKLAEYRRTAGMVVEGSGGWSIAQAARCLSLLACEYRRRLI